MKHIFILALLCPFLSYCQPLSIKGKVVSEFNDPVQRATITVKRTRISTTADNEGNFTVTNLRINDTLIVSAIGFITSEEIYDYTTPREIIVTLQRKTALLREVTISTGYQNLPRERSTGSFTQLDSRQLDKQINTNILPRLEALANGLTVDRTTNSSGKLMIRGLSTIRGPKDPLIIVDNFPYDGDISNINPNDVESITLLKDAAAASIWGARAGNGVVVITTKKGRFAQPLSIELTNNLTITAKPDLSHLKLMSTSDFIDVEQFLFSRNFYNSQLTTTPPGPLSPVVETLYKKAAGQISAADADAYINSLRSLDLRDQYDRYLYQQGIYQQHALTLQGGSSSLAWLFSAGYDHTTNELAADYERVNLRWQQTWKLTSKWQFSSALALTNSNSTSGKPGWGSISVNSNAGIYPYARFADEQGTSLPLPKNFRQIYIDTVGAGKLLNWNYYPLEDYKHNRTASKAWDMILNLGMQYRILNGLSLDVKYQYQQQSSGRRNTFDQDSYFARDLINRFSQINRSTGVVTYRVPVGSILDLYSSTEQSHNARLSLNYSKTWRDHNLVVLLGDELRQTSSNENTYRTYGYDDDILTYTNVDYATAYPTIPTGSTQFIPNANGFSRGVYRNVSFFGNAAYTYRRKYTVTLSARKDASNLFGVSTNNKWNPLWSSGFAWEISKEDFYHLSLLPYLKLRATYGYSGNTDPNMAAVTTINYLSASPYTGTPYARFAAFANPELRWEKIGMLNIGADFGTKNNRIEGSIEYYHKKGKDLFGTAAIDYTSGVGATIIKNVASIKGDGVDVELHSVNVKGRFVWTSQLNFSYNTDKVTDYYIASKQGRNFIGNGTQSSISAIIGKPVYAVYSYKWAGLDPATGDPRGYLNGVPSTDYAALMGSTVTVDSLRYHGNALPKFFGSFGNTFSFKNFELEVRLLYKLDYYFRRNTINYGSLFAWTGHSDYALRWQKPGDEAWTTVPSMVYPASSNRDAFYSGSEATVERGDHIGLQYISLSWLWQRPRDSRFPVKSLRFLVNANNLGIIWRANGQDMDPEYRVGLPPVKTFAFGVRTNF